MAACRRGPAVATEVSSIRKCYDVTIADTRVKAASPSCARAAEINSSSVLDITAYLTAEALVPQYEATCSSHASWLAKQTADASAGEPHRRTRTTSLVSSA